MFNKDELNQLYRYALSLSAHEESAYDLVQAAIERYLKKSSTLLVPIEKPLAYIKKIIRHHYFDLQRHKNVVPIISIETDEISYIEPIEDDSMEDLLINQQEVQQLIADLTAEDNELLYLWAVEEHTVEEIARIYNKPKGTMLSKLHRLKKRLRGRLPKSGMQSNSVGDINKGKLYE